METQTKRIIAWLLIPLFISAFLAFSAYFEIEPHRKMSVNFYDVGQGDSIFISTYGGSQVLIDGGPGSAVLSLLGKDMPFFDRTIELVILTHPHSDHVSGLIDVIQRYKVEKVIMPEINFDSQAYQRFLTLVEQENAEKIYAYEGLRIWLDEATAFDIYHPGKGLLSADNEAKGLNGDKRNPNDTSIVGKLTFGRTKFLFTADAGFEIENYILPRYNLDSDVLKVGHQGSRFSSSAGFIDEVTPTHSIISVGKNNYGHPNPEVVKLLEQKNSKVLRTDEHGTVRFESDGAEVYLLGNK